MNEHIKFLKYEPSHSEEEKFLGIATFRYYGMILRMKMVETKDGHKFLAFGSFRRSIDGEYTYEDWAMIESRYEESEIKDYLMREIKTSTQQQSSHYQQTHQQNTPANAQTHQQPIPSFGAEQGQGSPSVFDDEKVPF